jgi:hypothetical protein
MAKKVVGATAGVLVAVGVRMAGAVGVVVTDRVCVAVKATHTATNWLGPGVAKMFPPLQVTAARSPAFSVTVTDMA